jgi:hypothetical protein
LRIAENAEPGGGGHLRVEPCQRRRKRACGERPPQPVGDEQSFGCRAEHELVAARAAPGTTRVAPAGTRFRFSERCFEDVIGFRVQ